MRRTRTSRSAVSVAALCTLGAVTLTACGGSESAEASSGYTGEIGYEFLLHTGAPVAPAAEPPRVRAVFSSELRCLSTRS